MKMKLHQFLQRDKEAEAIIEEETTGALPASLPRRSDYLSDRWSVQLLCLM